MKKKINLIVNYEDKNLRIDIFVNKRLREISRTRIKNLIKDKKLKLNKDIQTNPSKKISPGDTVDLTIPEPKKPL